VNREQLYKVRDLMKVGDIKAVSEKEYRLNDKGVIRLINEIERLRAIIKKKTGAINSG